ncbi:MAG: hypothetical protein KJO50_07685, partial [Bacteroidia bacterium]|nr:hypothetical protein [Bacteroidia bacterium]
MSLKNYTKRIFNNYFFQITCLICLSYTQAASQCSSSCGSDNASAGETSCVNIGVPLAGMELGLDAINNNPDPQIVAALNGNELVDELQNCCGNDDNCLSIFFTIPNNGGAVSLEEINSIGSGSVFIDCVDLSNNFDEVIPYAAGQYELIFCPPGSSGSKRIGLAPVFEVDAAVTDETIDGLDDGEISVTYNLGNPNVSPSGTVMYSIDGISGTTENNTGQFTDLSDGDYTVHVYDSADSNTFNATDVTIAAGIVCDINEPDLDCDGDGVNNSADCDPEDATVLGVGSACTTSVGNAGTLDSNCYCIANSGGTSSGGTGGLESQNRLAQKIARRNYSIYKDHSKIFAQKINGEIPFGQGSSFFKTNGIDIYKLIPVNLWNAYVAESTPIGLEDITNATEVLSTDFYLDGTRTAVAMIIKSEDGVYEHSKAVCDRLDGAKLMDIDYTEILNQSFITYKIQNLSNEIEYALSFSGYIEGNQLVIENHWNIDDYKKGEEYVNFQIWASSIEKLQSLTTSILNNLLSQIQINRYIVTGYPNAYVQDGYYQNGSLYLTFNNKGGSTNIKIKGSLRNSESAIEESYNEIIELKGNTTQLVRLNTGNLYDIGMVLEDSSGYYDGLFVADGTWGYEENSINAQVLNFSIEPQDTNYDLTRIQVERGINAEVYLKSYQNIYRSLTPKWTPVNLNETGYISFTASNSCDIEITIVKESEKDWSRQIRKRIPRSESESSYTLKLSDFENYSHNQD